MKKFLVCALVVGVSFGLAARPAQATKPFSDTWKELYLTDTKDEAFKKLVENEAKCNVCHVDGEDKKKVRNPYGVAVQKLVNNKEFPKARWTAEADKVKAEVKAAFKKVEAEKAKDGKTFGEKIKAGQLPGGDAKGK